MNLTEHIQSAGTIRDIAAYLDNLEPGTRWAELQGLSKACQRTLYLKAEASEPLTLDDFVPDGVEAVHEVIHQGRNSLPFFRSFEKRFMRGPDGRVGGYNEGAVRALIGPGYFIARETDDDPRGAIVIDYFQVPEGPVPTGWPTVKANWRGLQFFVYHKTRDYMRRVSKGVTVGSAYKTFLGRERKLDSFFILAR